jgi:hypothetical protein
MKKLTAVFLIICMLFVGCKEETPKMPYGKEMQAYYITADMGVTRDPSLAMEEKSHRTTIWVDSTYVNEKQIEVVAKYVYAIQNNNLEVYTEIMYPLFRDYVEAATGVAGITLGDWLQQNFTYVYEQAGDDFYFYEVTISLYDDYDMQGKAGYLLDDLYKITEFEEAYNAQNGISGSKLSKKNVHTIGGEMRFITPDGQDKYADLGLYVFEVDGEYKLMKTS